LGTPSAEPTHGTGAESPPRRHGDIGGERTMAQPTTPGPAVPAGLWWAMAISGTAAILFGLAAILWPGLTLLVLVALFGVYAIIEGIAELIAMFRALRLNAAWWPHLLLAVLSLGAGILVLLYPGITSVLLLYFIAFWAIAVGLVEAVASVFAGQWLRVL